MRNKCFIEFYTDNALLYLLHLPSKMSGKRPRSIRLRSSQLPELVGGTMEKAEDEAVRKTVGASKGSGDVVLF